MRRYRVVHETSYTYETKVTRSYGQLCLLPRDIDHQRCVASQVEVDPTPSDHRERTDYFGNRVAYFTLHEPHDHLVVRATSEVDVDDEQPWHDTPSGSFADTVAAVEQLSGAERVESADFLVPSPRITIDDRVREYAAPSFAADRPILEVLADLTSRIHADFEFSATATTVTSTIDDLFESGAGVCQDFAHLGVACLRSQGIPARYVSGYLETDPPPGREKLVGADVSHAWVAAQIPELGWVDIDPTNDQFANGRYVTTGWGRDYGDVAPLKGVVFSDGGTTTLDVSVDVRRID